MASGLVVRVRVRLASGLTLTLINILLYKRALVSTLLLLKPLLCSGGRLIRVSGQNLDVVQEPKMRVTLSPPDTLPPRRRRRRRWESVDRRIDGAWNTEQDHGPPLKRRRRIVPEVECPDGTLCHVKHVRSDFHKPDLSSTHVVPL